MSDSEDVQSRTGFRKFAKKILSDEDGNSPVDPKEMLSSLLQLSDKARTETVRLVAKEFRGYLDALEIKEDLHDFMTSYSVEVKASFRLKPVKKSKSANRRRTHGDADSTEESSEES
jgi:hypothetical protein